MSKRSVSQAVILSGGKGSRLSTVSGGNPKILTPINKSSLLEDILGQLSKIGLSRVLFLLGHKSEIIVSQLIVLRSKFDFEISWLIEEKPLGTAGAIQNANRLGLLEDCFLLLHGDLVVRTDLLKFIDSFTSKDIDGVFLVHPSSHLFDSDIVVLNNDGDVVNIYTKPHIPLPLARNLCNAGIYVLDRTVLDSTQETFGDFDRELLPTLVQKGRRFKGFRNYGFVKDMGTPSRLLSIGEILPQLSKGASRPALFIDRDGTINIPKGHISSWKEIELYDDAIRLIKRFNEARYWVLVITNQPVIARGNATFLEMQQINSRIDQILANHNAYIDEYFVCPHHPDFGYEGEIASLKVDCECRKPKSGLITEAMSKFPVDLSRSIFVGDSWRDKALGDAFGLLTFTIDRNSSSEFKNPIRSLDEISPSD